MQPTLLIAPGSLATVATPAPGPQAFRLSRARCFLALRQLEVEPERAPGAEMGPAEWIVEIEGVTSVGHVRHGGPRRYLDTPAAGPPPVAGRASQAPPPPPRAASRSGSARPEPPGGRGDRPRS